MHNRKKIIQNLDLGEKLQFSITNQVINAEGKKESHVNRVGIMSTTTDLKPGALEIQILFRASKI